VASYAASAASHKGIRRGRSGVESPMEPTFALIFRDARTSQATRLRGLSMRAPQREAEIGCAVSMSRV